MPRRLPNSGRLLPTRHRHVLVGGIGFKLAHDHLNVGPDQFLGVCVAKQIGRVVGHQHSCAMEMVKPTAETPYGFGALKHRLNCHGSEQNNELGLQDLQLC